MIRPMLLLATLTLLCGAARAEENVPWNRLCDLAAKYLDVCSDPKDVAKCRKKLDGIVEQRLLENESASEDSVMRSLMLDWAAGARAKIKKKEHGAVVQACFYFVIFQEKGYNMPGMIGSEMTDKVVREISEFLEGEIQKAGK